MRRVIYPLLIFAIAMGVQAPAANALALRWEMVRTSNFVEEFDIPAGRICDFPLHVRTVGSFQEMFGYDTNDVLRVYRFQNWGPYSLTLSANGNSLTIEHQSVVETFTFDEQGDLLRIVNVGIDNLWVAPGTGFIVGNVGRFIVVDGEVVWKVGPQPTPEGVAALCAQFA
jgi:hypothetical protein